MRRRALLASVSERGYGDSMFPIYLVTGDNGEIGKALYQFVINNTQNPPYFSYRFSEDEVIILNSKYAANKRIVYMYKPNHSLNVLAIEYEDMDWSHYLSLYEDGTITEYYD